MDKIKTVKIKNEDGSVSQESYYISADARNIDMANGYNVQETIGTIDINEDGNIVEQLNNLNINIKKKAYYFDTVANMKNANLQVGDYAITLGYYEPNDGGNGEYKIVDGNYIDDGGSYHKLNNGFYAELIIENSINFKQFGAYGDGIHNDFQAIDNACTYANEETLLILNLDGNYYVDGEQIILSTSVKNSNAVTFILGNSYLKYNSLFKYEHDSTTSYKNVSLSTVFSSKGRLTNDYLGKSFLLDTKINHGLRSDQPYNGGNLIEPFYCTNKYELLWFGDYDGNLIVDVNDVADSNETGYSFTGGNIIQKNNDTYGVSFLTINRNNCIVKDLNIRCESTLAENAVLYIHNGNNCKIDNIHCGSNKTPGHYGYDISLSEVSNIYTSNISSDNGTTDFGNRTVKNWNIIDSIINVWDIHWNAFGILNIENCTIRGSIQVGYGNGILNVINSYALWLKTNDQFMQIYRGQINIQNSYLNDGVLIQTSYTQDSTRDSYFDNYYLPNINITNAIRSYSIEPMLNDIAISIPITIHPLIQKRGVILLDNVDMRRIWYAQKSTATTKIYDTILRDCGHVSTTILESLDALGKVTGYGISSRTEKTTEITPNTVYASDTFSGIVKKTSNNSCTVKCLGTVNTTVTSSMVLATLPEEFRPSEIVYGIIVWDDIVHPCSMGSSGRIFSYVSVPNGSAIKIYISYII